MIELEIAEAQTIGARTEQQDAAAVVRLGNRGDGALLVLADGLGGHANGAQAAGIVVETFRNRAEAGAFDSPDERRRALAEAIQETNGRIFDSSNPADGDRSMGSTAVAAIIAEGRLSWISVGDSHLYVWRRGRLVKLNADHSRAGMMIRQGFAPNHAAVLSSRALLASALTGHAIEEIDAPADDVALAIGDVVLLASDGLDTLDGGDIARIVGEGAVRPAEAQAGALIDAIHAEDLPRQDNATVVVVRIVGHGAPAKADDALPETVPIAERDASPATRGRWPLAVCVALLAALLAGAIIAQMR